MKAKARGVSSIDPSADLPEGTCLVKASKGLAVLLSLFIVVLVSVGTLEFYDKLALSLLVEQNRQIAEGTVVAVSDTDSGKSIAYEFQVHGREFRGSDHMTDEQAGNLFPGSYVDVAYAPSMPSVHRLRMLLPASETTIEDAWASLILSARIVFWFWILVWCASSWEHVFLFLRYSFRGGGPAWIQVLRALHNGLFMLLAILLLFLLMSLAMSFETGAYTDFWPWQAGGMGCIAVVLGLLIKWTPFRNTGGASDSPTVEVSFR